MPSLTIDDSAKSTQSSQQVLPASAERRRRRRRESNGGITVLLLRLGVLAAVVLIWQLYYASGRGEPLLIKSPRNVYDAFQTLLSTGQLWSNLWATVTATLIALALGSTVGIIVGVGFALTPRLERVFDPFIDALNAMPRIALAPVFIIYFGIGLSAKVALAFSLVVFVVLVSARSGVRSADRDVLQLATVLGSNRFQRFVKVLVPVALPSIFGGVRLGLIYSLLGVVASELISARDGLGQLIAVASSNLDMSTVYAILIVLAILSAFFNFIMNFGISRLLRWQPPAQH